MKGFFLKNCTLLFLLWLPYLSYAEGIQISPVRVYIEPGELNSSFTIYNRSDEPVLFQLKAVKWHQKAGEDIYSDTHDIIINPPIMNIGPDSYQLFRVGLRNPLPANNEHFYRIFATQVATKKNTVIKNQIQTLLEFNIPVFILPKEEQKDLIVELRKIKDQLELRIANESNVHIQIAQIDIYPDKNKLETPLYSQDTFVYLLPKQEKTWDLPWNKPKDMDDLALKLRTDWGDILETLRVAP